MATITIQALTARLTTASRDLLPRVSKALAAESLTQVQLGFRASRAPSGDPWASLALRSGKPLMDTGRLRNSYTYTLLADGFRLGTGVAYAPTHQHGATILPVRARLLRFKVRGGKTYFAKKTTIPARPMVPTGSDLGPIWGPALQKAGAAELRRAMGG